MIESSIYGFYDKIAPDASRFSFIYYCGSRFGPSSVEPSADIQRIFGSQPALKTVEDFTEFEQCTAYFRRRYSIKKGIVPGSSQQPECGSFRISSTHDIAAMVLGNPIVVIASTPTCRSSSGVQPASNARRV
jgi:hypothetical protein